MKSKPVIAIAGATGLVGSEMINCLDLLKGNYSAVRLLASQDSVGEIYKIGDDEVAVELLEERSFEGVDVALFATSAELSKKYVPAAVAAGAIAIDNSSHFRMDPNVPLVVPEVNFAAVTPNTKIIANPNCSTIQLTPVLAALEQAAGLKRVVVTTFQSVSGAGKAALDELWSQTLSIFNQKEIVTEEFAHQIAFNCIPQIDVMLENGYTKEEMKIINESRKILSLPSLNITTTAVRVPVLHSHAESVNVELKRALSTAALIEALRAMPGVEVYPDHAEFPMQLETAGTDEIRVGRIRVDESVPHGFNLWIVADNLRKGAALNAVQILQRLLPAH